MDEMPPDPKSIVIWLLGIVMALLAWIGKSTKREHERRLEVLEASAVRKGEIEKLRTDLRDEHEDNTRRLESIETAVTGTHRRLDDLYRDLIGRNNSR